MKTNISVLISTLEEIGKSKFNFDSKLKDYKYNGEEIINVKENYYSQLKKIFDESLSEQLVNKKVDKNLIESLINMCIDYFEDIKERKGFLRGSYLLNKSKNLLKESAEWTHEAINAIMKAQLNTIKSIHSNLNQLRRDFSYLTVGDLENLKINLGKDTSRIEDISLQKFGNATFKLSKKDTISLLLILEYIGYIDFSETDKNKFIESNFNYLDTKNKVKPLVKINSDISNLMDNKTYNNRNKTSNKKLIDNLTEALEAFDYDAFVRSYSQ